MPEERSVLVLDASIGVMHARREAGWDYALRILRSQGAQDGPIFVPAFFWMEFVNVLVRRFRFPPDAVIEAIADLDAAGLQTVELDRTMLLSVLDAVVRHGLSAYDATYLALAELMDADLVTADAELALAAGDRGRLIGGKEIRETRQTYPAGSWADWPGAAAYLRELRARVTAGS